MDFNASELMRMPLPHQQPAVTLTFDLQNLTWSSLMASGYSL